MRQVSPAPKSTRIHADDSAASIGNAERAGQVIEARWPGIETGKPRADLHATQARREPELTEEEEDHAFAQMAHEQRWSDPRWWDRYGAAAVAVAMDDFHEGPSA